MVIVLSAMPFAPFVSTSHVCSATNSDFADPDRAICCCVIWRGHVFPAAVLCPLVAAATGGQEAATKERISEQRHCVQCVLHITQAAGACIENLVQLSLRFTGFGQWWTSMPLVLMQGFFRKALESRVTAGLLLSAAAFLLGSAAVAGDTNYARTLTTN